MDNQEHHPHLVKIGYEYSNDYYEREVVLTKNDFQVGCICFLLLMVLFLCGLLVIIAGNNVNTNKFEQSRIDSKEIEAHKKFVEDSIARYQVLHDSIFEATRIQDSINAELVKQQKIKVDYIAFIDDGVTSRQVVINTLADSITPNDITILGNSFAKMTYSAVKDRQNEIDNNKEYYTKRVKYEEN